MEQQAEKKAHQDTQTLLRPALYNYGNYHSCRSGSFILYVAGRHVKDGAYRAGAGVPRSVHNGRAYLLAFH